MQSASAFIATVHNEAKTKKRTAESNPRRRNTNN